jgi:glycerol uptake facilitator-like aquaporin
MLKLSQNATCLVAEFVGTFLFVLTIPLASIGVGSLAPIPIGFMLMAMVFSFGYISGGHFNPAVSFAVMVVGQMPIKKFVAYTIVQVLAAVFATLYGVIIVGLDVPAPTTNNDLVKVWQAFLAELVYTFALANVVLHVACSRQKGNDFYGFAIGMTVLSAAFSVGGFTGGAFNPAVATGTQLVRCMTMQDCIPLAYVWLYWFAPLGGALLGGMLFNILDTFQAPPPTSRIADFH